VSGPRAILFDATGTLISVRGSVGERYARAAAARGIRLEPARAASAFAAALAAAPPLCFPALPRDARERAARGWWREVVGATVRASVTQGQEPCAPGEPAFEGLFDDLYGSFAGSEAWSAAEGAEAVLAELVRRGYRLGVLSNFDGRLPGILAALGLAGYLGRIETSVGLGVAKPDPDAFRRALARLGVPASDAAYVGDSPETDARGAAAAGLRPVLLRAALPSGVDGHSIAVLTDLLDLFAGSTAA
jgi:putative hydrolase of the HAD superfamily